MSNPLLSRLSGKLGAKGIKNPSAMASALLNKFGDMSGQGLSKQGKSRVSLGIAGRAAAQRKRNAKS